MAIHKILSENSELYEILNILFKNIEKNSHNLLGIFGENQTTKKELLNTIENELKQKHKKVIRLTPCDFTKILIAEGYGAPYKYQIADVKNADVMIIEEVDLFDRYQRGAGLFLEVSQAFLKANKQVIITSHKHPKNTYLKFKKGLFVEVK